MLFLFIKWLLILADGKEDKKKRLYFADEKTWFDFKDNNEIYYIYLISVKLGLELLRIVVYTL